MSLPGNIIPDQLLIKGCIANDRKSQEQLYKRFYTPMIALCFRYTKNQEDATWVLHEGLLKVFLTISEFDESRSPLYAWIHKIMVITSVDFLHRKKLKAVNIAWKSDTEPAIPPAILIDKSAEEIVFFLKQLPEMSAAVFNLCVIEGYKHKKIAHLLQITEGTSKWHLSEAKRQLTNCFEKEPYFKWHGAITHTEN
ncbi:MAG: RNA polymerase sigma factor [Bacteroidota bacterium]